MSTAKKTPLIKKLQDKEYRDAFVSEHVDQGITFQVHAMREARKLTQAQLGKLLGMKQPQVARLEDPDYSNYTLDTLKRVASAFDVALIVRFAPFGELVEYVENLSPEALAVPPFAEEGGVCPSAVDAVLEDLLETMKHAETTRMQVPMTAQDGAKEGVIIAGTELSLAA